VVLLFTLGNSSDSFIILLGQNRGLDIVQIMLMLMTFNFVYASLSVPWVRGRIKLAAAVSSRRLDRVWPRLSRTGFFECRLACLVLYALYGIYYAATDGVGRALVADFVPENGAAPPTASTMPPLDYRLLPASVIAGVLWQGLGTWHGFGASAPFYFGAALAFAGRGLVLAFGSFQIDRLAEYCVNI